MGAGDVSALWRDVPGVGDGGWRAGILVVLMPATPVMRHHKLEGRDQRRRVEEAAVVEQPRLTGHWTRCLGLTP